MTISEFLRKSCQAVFFPQHCVLCSQGVLNADFSPLCRPCLGRLERLPRRICYYCGTPLPGNVLEEFAACARCRSGLFPFEFARSCGPYEGKLREVIRKFKFEGFRHLAHPLAHLLEESYRESRLEFDPDWMVPVPLHRRRRRQRGFDQTLLLCRILSRRLGATVFRDLRRVRHTPPLFGLDTAERQRALRGAFSLAQADRLANCNLLLVDDVMTTGATVQEICRLFRREAKPARIMVLTVARVPLLYAD